LRLVRNFAVFSSRINVVKTCDSAKIGGFFKSIRGPPERKKSTSNSSLLNRCRP